MRRMLFMIDTTEPPLIFAIIKTNDSANDEVVIMKMTNNSILYEVPRFAMKCNSGHK